MADPINKLADFLERHGLSQETFADSMRVPQAQISLWINGRRRPGLENALRIEEVTKGEIPASYWRTVTPQRRRKRHPPKVALP